MLLVLTLFELDRIAPPKALLLAAFWAFPGYMAAKNETDGGALHGMLGGLFGGLLSCLMIFMLKDTSWLVEVGVTDRQYLLILILAGFWGAFGGIITDIKRASKARKAQRQMLAEMKADKEK